MKTHHVTNLRGYIVNLSLFVKVISVYSGLIFVKKSVTFILVIKRSRHFVVNANSL